MKSRRSSVTLALAGTVVMGLGLYFAVLRPALLPEDARYIGASLVQVETTVPGLSTWLRHVFWVMGGFMFATGVLTFYVAVTGFRSRSRGAFPIAAVAGASSVGSMAIINFLIRSDFKWELLVLALLWGLALAFHLMEGSGRKPPRARDVRSSKVVHAGDGAATDGTLTSS